MILVYGSTMLNASVVHSIMVSPITKEDKVYPKRYWYKPETWSLKPTITKETWYRLTVEYVRTDGSGCRFTSESTNHTHQQGMAKDFLKQIKMQTDMANQELVDKLFEDAIKESK